MAERIVIDVDRDGWTKGLQLNIVRLDDNDCGSGYRLHGPKYNGSSKNLLRHELTERDAAEIREALDAVFPQPSQPSRAEALDEAIGTLNSMWSLAPSTHRASGINFAIGVLMGLRDEAPTSAPVESAGDETGEALVVGWERMVIKAAVANALDGHRNDADLATHITNEVISNLHEARGGGR